jgi:hypothetical protein
MKFRTFHRPSGRARLRFRSTLARQRPATSERCRHRDPRSGGVRRSFRDRDGQQRAGAVVVSDRAAIFTVSIARNAGRVTGVGLRTASALTDAAGQPRRAPGPDGQRRHRAPAGRTTRDFLRRSHARGHPRHGRARASAHRPPPGSVACPAMAGTRGLPRMRAATSTPWPSRRPATGRSRSTAIRWRVAAFREPAAHRRLPSRRHRFRRPRAALRAGAAVHTGWFSSRITRYSVGTNGVGASAGARSCCRRRWALHGNLEGLSLWRSGGTLIASAVADNNFRQPGRRASWNTSIPD